MSLLCSMSEDLKELWLGSWELTDLTVRPLEGHVFAGEDQDPSSPPALKGAIHQRSLGPKYGR